MPRLITNKIEYIIKCKCGARYGYIDREVGQQGPCGRCGNILQLDGSHDTYIMEKVKMTYSTKKLPPPE